MKGTKNAHCEQPKRVFNEEMLSMLCKQNVVEIGSGNYKHRLCPRIRYVIGRDRFGYANFGDFFFWYDGGLYVWQQSEEFKEDHNTDIVEGFFGKPCEGRGYALRSIFAGIDTGYDDCNGSCMFTGDVVLVKGDNGYEYGALCLASVCDLDGKGFYGFPLDNHSLTLDTCRQNNYHLERIGTIFYQLNPCEEPIAIWHQAVHYNNARCDLEQKKTRRTMARYTPNFDQEEWKYLGLEVLGVEEFNWNKNI